MGRGLYIHIPFCVKKCNYCAFLSFNADESPRKEYSEALINEIRTAGSKYACRGTGDRGRCRIDTIYIGGGTPSVMDVSQLSLVMKAVRSEFDVAEDAEITIEANPGTIGRTERVTRTKLTAYRYMGVNRLSFGVQSMDNDRLAYLGRIHTAEDVVRDIRYAREAGFDNINLDLIFSVPGETTADALSDAARLIELEPEHISCYSLQLEEGTPFYEMAERGELAEVSDEEDRRTYHRICALLADAGYERYEISNFARRSTSGSRSYRSRHNSGYWDMSEYIGLGLGASGYVSGVRYRNTPELGRYIDLYGAGNIAAGHTDPADETCAGLRNRDHGSLHGVSGSIEDIHVNSPFDNASEAVFTGLRRSEGVSYREVISAYDAAGRQGSGGQSEEDLFWDIFSDAREEAIRYADSGHLIIDDDGIRLTDSGIDISNGIMSLFV